MEGHPESFISSKNQQFKPSQLVAQTWAPIHIPDFTVIGSRWLESHSFQGTGVSKSDNTGRNDHEKR
jgi:hypothetical protein